MTLFLQGDILAAEKVFSGSGLKSRKIAISSIDKSKVFGEFEQLFRYRNIIFAILAL